MTTSCCRRRISESSLGLDQGAPKNHDAPVFFSPQGEDFRGKSLSNENYAELRSVAPPVRDTLQDRVYRELRLALMSGRFLPGRALSIRGVASALGTSPMPVREALRQLVAERALTMLPKGSVGTALLSANEFSDLLEVRMEIEGYAARRAAAAMSIDAIETLAKLNDTMHATFAAGEQETYISLNREFHFMIYRTSGSEVILPVIETLWLQAGPYLGAAFNEHPRGPEAPDNHARIIAGLRARDTEGVASAVRADLADAALLILQSPWFADPANTADRASPAPAMAVER